MGIPPQPETGSWLADVDDADVGFHAVTFYDRDESLLELVSAFVAPAHRAAGGIVLLLTPWHRPLLEECLARAGVAVDSPGCVWLDTEAVMAKTMSGGHLDRDAFRTVVLEALEEVSQSGRPLRIYGELVAHLWQLGHVVAAMEVEDVWNEVLGDRGGALLCGYPRHLFRTDPEGGPAAVCTKHGSVVQLEGGSAAPQCVPTPGSLPLGRKVFLAALAHDLQGPTAVVSGLLDLLRLGRIEGDEDVSADLLARASDGARRVQRLVSDVAALSHMDNGRFDYEFTSFDLGEVARRTADDLAMITRRTVTVDVDPDLPPVRADRDRQAQILDNLIGNGIKYSTPEQAVDVHVRRDGDWAVVTVSDLGPGLQEGDRHRIFDAFTRAESTSEIPGSGLGLYTARLLVEGQGGRITLTSEPEGGARFSYTAPLAPPQEQPEDEPQAGPEE